MNEYKSKDLGECAALICKSAKLLRLEPQGNYYYFIFSNKLLCQELSNQYWFGELPVNAKAYNDALRTLKDRLFSQK